MPRDSDSSQQPLLLVDDATTEAPSSVTPSLNHDSSRLRRGWSSVIPQSFSHHAKKSWYSFVQASTQRQTQATSPSLTSTGDKSSAPDTGPGSGWVRLEEDSPPQSERNVPTVFTTSTNQPDVTIANQAADDWKPKVIEEKKVAGDSELCVRFSIGGPQGRSKQIIKLTFVADYRIQHGKTIISYGEIFLVLTIGTVNGKKENVKKPVGDPKKIEEGAESFSVSEENKRKAVRRALVYLTDRIRYQSEYMLRDITTAEGIAKKGLSDPAFAPDARNQERPWTFKDLLDLAEGQLTEERSQLSKDEVRTDTSTQEEVPSSES